ncbi:hypothetical protein PC41400_09570 [Paenibacillus chitinolyticus]|uniref:DUF5682 family protein n=1 Tax=Paenibacillus chitinolyticus TaxID=79263 RepID=A0A410WU69_9BACL|nr:DUF5682 family protein [Paenibacillus chitinolyticus]MCY9591976.1 DUF5682 family protein [Paenibacillus chitinolyticus]MCY9595033.1 DUF5682 family protein [Paenibacillus chitinolyticus]QAV17902.1 hypothetical protein PC41400_09570 [Paenibacillus chitinolyticus]
MAEPVQRLLGTERVSEKKRVNVFGIRHLSPAGAYHLRALLEEKQPTAILVEGPSDANDYIHQLTMSGVKPPVALLAYTEELPVRTLIYPFASYSPEYEAFRWAKQHGIHAEFMDLPSTISLTLYENRKGAGRKAKAEAVQAGEGKNETSDRASYVQLQNKMYEQITELSGEPDYEAYWERYFEHCTSKEAYREAIDHYSIQMRALMEEAEQSLAPEEAAYNEIREAYMRRKIEETIRSGHAPEKIVVVTGAHHASALRPELLPMTDRELEGLPKVRTKITLMPYSYYKLSTYSGYGAGNQAPAYYELFWTCLQQNELWKLPTLYLSKVAAYLRDQGTYRSTASVIEGVRLAQALAVMHDGTSPTWRELRDAAIVLMGYGELSVISEALAKTDVGTAIGSLPDGVSQTPIQDDLNRELKRFKLEKYKTTVATTLELDLRENRRVKTVEAAFIDLNRSVLLHRLELLGISFVKKQHVSQASASWAENWVLQWSPEAEIEAVESTLKGETIELAAAFVIHEKLQACADIAEASRIIRLACTSDLPSLMEQARGVLQELAVDSGNFEQIASAALELSVLIGYGSIRRIATDSLIPLLEQLFLRGSLLLVDAANCNDEAAKTMASAIQTFHSIAQEHYEIVDDQIWLQKLRELSMRDDRNAKLSGLAFSILLERNEVDEARSAQEMSRRLSPGIPADLGAGWFEGLAMRNRYALLSRSFLWEQLDAYIQSLENEQFYRSLVFLRRAFGTFEAREKANIAELMGELWGLGAIATGEALQRPLGEEEKEKLDELNDFDFGDL